MKVFLRVLYESDSQHWGLTHGACDWRVNHRFPRKGMVLAYQCVQRRWISSALNLGVPPGGQSWMLGNICTDKYMKPVVFHGSIGFRHVVSSQNSERSLDVVASVPTTRVVGLNRSQQKNSKEYPIRGIEIRKCIRKLQMGRLL